MRIAYVNYGDQSGVTPNLAKSLVTLGHDLVRVDPTGVLALRNPRTRRPRPTPRVLMSLAASALKHGQQLIHHRWNTVYAFEQHSKRAGALLAGLALRRGEPPRTAAAVGTIRSTGAESSISASSWQAWDTLRQFSLAFFIPIYFFTVGLKLDLIHNFEVRFFLCFFVLSCGLKASSIWFGAKLAGQPSGRAWDLAVALNARGGPGIVLATVTFQAGIINDSFFTSIVLLSVVTSQLAGFWLDRRFAAVVTDAVSAQTAHETPGQPDPEAIALPSNTLTGSERVQDADRPDIPERA